MHSRQRKVCKAVIAAGLFLACSDLGPPVHVLGNPLASWTVGSLGTLTLPTPADVNSTTAPQSTSFTLGNGVPTRITVSGLLQFTVDAGYLSCTGGNPPPALPGGTTVGPKGYPGGQFKIKLDQRNGADIPLDPAATQTTQNVVIYFQYRGDSGVIKAGRPSAFSYSCGQGSYNPGYDASGTQTVQVEALDSALLVPDKLVAAPGDTVQFTIQLPWSVGVSGRAWHWVPDTTTNTSTLIGTCYNQPSCQVVVRERGHVVVDTIWTWGIYSPTGIRLQAQSPVIQSGPLTVELSGGSELQPAGTGGSSSLPLEVRVKTASGTAVPNRTVSLIIDGIEQTGGHTHSGTMPPGSVSPSTVVVTGANGVGTFTYTAPDFGGTIDIRGRSGAASQGTKALTVRVPDLTQLDEGAHVEWIGVKGAHPGSHFGTPSMVSRMQALADTFYGQFNGRRLPVNDISLIRGGKFDVDSSYTSGGEHAEHKDGLSADVRSSGGGADSLTTDQQDFVRAVWPHLGGHVAEHPPLPGDPHFHLRF